MMRFSTYILVVLLLVAGIFTETHAQDTAPDAPIDAILETTTLSPQLGEVFRITVVVRTSPDYVVTLDEMPVEGEDWGDFSVLSVGEVDERELGEGQIVLSLPLEVSVWERGEVTMPALFVSYTDIDGLTDRMVVTPLYFTVASTLDDNPELRISREVIRWRAIPRWVVLVVMGLSGVAILRLGLWGWRSRQKRVEDKDITERIQENIGQRTCQTLEQLPDEAPDFATQVSVMGDSLRVYVIERVGGDEQMTNGELVLHLAREEQLSVKRLKELRYLLNQSDWVKFAPKGTFQIDTTIVRRAIWWVEQVELELEEKST